MRTVLFTALAGLLLAGCDPPPPSKPLDESANEQPTAAQANEPSGAQKYDPMEKAKRVQPQVLDQKDQQDKQIDAQSH